MYIEIEINLGKSRSIFGPCLLIDDSNLLMIIDGWFLQIS